MDSTYVPQKKPSKSPRRTQTSTSWKYASWEADSGWSSNSQWQEGYQRNYAPQRRQRGSTPRGKGKKKKKEENAEQLTPAPEPPWNPNYAGGPSVADSEAPSGAQEKLVKLAIALSESNTSVPSSVQHIVSEHSTPVPTTKGLNKAVDKMGHARKKLKEAEKARLKLHASWRHYIADSLKRWKTFAEKFAKDDQDLAEKVRLAKERLQQTKDDVEAKKQALEDLDEEEAVEISDEEMPEKVVSAEHLQESINHMVMNLGEMQQKAEAAIVDAGESKAKRPRIEEGREGDGAEKPGTAGPSSAPFG